MRRNSFPGLNTTTRRAGTATAVPVLGLRALSLRLRLRVRNVPKPRISTVPRITNSKLNMAQNEIERLFYLILIQLRIASNAIDDFCLCRLHFLSVLPARANAAAKRDFKRAALR